MKEQLISFETAELAAEKGFEVYTNDSYRPDTKEMIIGFCPWDNYSAPSQSLLQRYLREKHHIFVFINFTTKQNKVSHFYFNMLAENIKGETIYRKDVYSSYEEALEIGLQEALKLI